MNNSIHAAPHENIFGSLLVGLYSWVIGVNFGAVLLDIVYSRTIDDVLSAENTMSVFGEVSDFLLLVVTLTMLFAIAAIGFAWNLSATRRLFVASALVIILPVFALPFIGPSLQELAVGHWIRLGLSGLASILAAIGLHNFHILR